MSKRIEELKRNAVPSAAKAKAQAEQAERKNIQDNLNSIVGHIKKAIAQAKYAIQIDGELDSTVKMILEKKGYDIKVTSTMAGNRPGKNQPQESIKWFITTYTTIRWS